MMCGRYCDQAGKPNMIQLNNKKCILLFFLTVMFIMIYWLCFNARYELIIQNSVTNKLVFQSNIKPGDNLWLIYINSVENLPVAEHYEINNNYQILFTEIIYQAPYVGYLNEESAEIVAPGTLRISDYQSPMEKVTFYAGDISKHMMFWNGIWVPLYNAAQGGDLIYIYIEKSFSLSNFFKKDIIHE